MIVGDSTYRIATITYINPDNGAFGALGHGISDIDTNTLMPCREGFLFKCLLTNPIKGKKGEPGALCGDFDDKITATFTKNSTNGLFGKISDLSSISNNSALPVAHASDISKGDAIIPSDVDGSGIKEYKIKIKNTIILS